MKNIDDLAIFGGDPHFERPVHVNRPNVGNQDVFQSYVDSAWDNRIFTNSGPIEFELEQLLQNHLEVPHCIVTSSGTSAMSLLVKALRLHGEVIIPSFTFTSTAHVLHWAGIKPIFCDIGRDDWNMDSDHCAALINSSVTAVIATHCWGEACNVECLEEICNKADIPLLFDAAHAFDCTHNRKKIGSFGTAEVFSFHATKVFHTFEGGAITTRDGELAEKLRIMKNFGFTDYDRTEMAGTNAKMSEIHAAMGIANISVIESTINNCRLVHEDYAKLLSTVTGIELQKPHDGESSNYQYVVCLVDQNKFGMSRDQLIRVLQRENILARKYFSPGCHLLEPYKTLIAHNDDDLPNTRYKSENVLVLPAGAGIERADVAEVCQIIRFINSHAQEISAQLA